MQNEYCVALLSLPYAKGTFMWALSQMKQGKNVCRFYGETKVGDARCRLCFNSLHIMVEQYHPGWGKHGAPWRFSNGDEEDFTGRLTLEDYEATNWRVLDEPNS